MKTTSNVTPMRKYVRKYKISRLEICQALSREGIDVSTATVYRLITENAWPKKVNREDVKRVLVNLFTKRGSEEETKTMFEHAPKFEKQQAVYGIGKLIQKYGLTQVQAAQAVSSSGLSFSDSALSRLINHGIWPITATKEQIMTPINNWLGQYATQKEIADMWSEQGQPQRTPTNVVKKAAEPSSKTTVIFEPLEREMLYQKTMKHFNLTRHPFENEVHCIDDLFMSQQQRRVRESMVQASMNGSILAVIGECGAGKTEIRKGFYQYVNTNHPELIVIEPMVIDKKRLTAGMIFDALAEELNIQRMPVSLEHRARKVERALKQSVKAGNRHVLVIEEAHDLSNDAIKHLKRVCELSDGFNRLVSVVLVGQPELEVKLNLTNYDIREFSYRCNILTLPPLGNEITNYIAHKFARCHIDYQKVVTPDAIDAMKQRLQGEIKYGVAKASGIKDMSYPLMVNSLLVKAMNAAASACEPIITAELVSMIK